MPNLSVFTLKSFSGHKRVVKPFARFAGETLTEKIKQKLVTINSVEKKSFFDRF